jgi:type VI secretion system protein ImpJ
VNEVIERLVATSRALGQKRRDRGPEAIGYGVGDLEQLLTRQVINQFIPALQNAVVNESIHPYLVYGFLAELHGALTSYWPDEEAWNFPKYDHDDLAGCFGPLAEAIRRLLDRLMPRHYLELLLRRDGFQFQTELEEQAFTRGTAWVLALRGAVGEDALRKRIETQAKLSSISDMKQLVSFADRGVPLKFVEYPPAEMPRYAGYLHFQLDITDRRFSRLKDGRDFAFFLPDAEPDLEGRLFIVLGRAAERRTDA